MPTTCYAKTEGRRKLRIRLPLTLVLTALLASCSVAGDEAADEARGDFTTDAESPVDDAATNGGAQEATTVTVGLQTGRHAATTGLWVALAEELGYFQDEGIEIDDLAFSSATDLLTGLESGELDINVMGSEGIIPASQGSDTTAIAGPVNISIWEPVSRPELQSWEDLRGATVGLSNLQGVQAAGFKEAARLAGFDPENDFDLIQAGAASQAYQSLLEGDNIDVVPAPAPLNFLAADNGLTTHGFAPPGEDIPQISVVQIVTQAAWAEENRAITEGFLRALLRTVEFAENSDNRDQLVEMAVPILQEGSAQIEESHVIQTLELYIDDPDFGPHAWHELFLEREPFENAARIFEEAGSVDNPISYDEYVDHSFLEAAAESLN